jgi:hypothetical protein
MGGYGSGRHSDRPSTDECIRFSLSTFSRDGVLKRGFLANRCERRTLCGQIVADLLVSIDIHCLKSVPQITFRGMAFGRRIDQSLELVSRAQPFGGERWLAVCPVSGRSCSTLVLPPGGRQFASVRGSRVCYPSQREAPVFRAVRARDKAEERFTMLSKYARIPTRRRLAEKAVQASWREEDLIAAWVMRHL